MTAIVRIVYDGDADPDRRLRSPDNLDWADDRRLYIQEDEAVGRTLAGEGTAAAHRRSVESPQLEVPELEVRRRRVR